MDYIVAPQWYGANKNTMEISHFQLLQSLNTPRYKTFVQKQSKTNDII